jgi:hypothetical protein
MGLAGLAASLPSNHDDESAILKMLMASHG